MRKTAGQHTRRSEVENALAEHMQPTSTAEWARQITRLPSSRLTFDLDSILICPDTGDLGETQPFQASVADWN